jgi:hypothetical protein
VAHRGAEPKPASQQAGRGKGKIGHVVIYLTGLAEKLGIDTLEAARAKLEINRQKYPAELIKGSVLKHTGYT